MDRNGGKQEGGKVVEIRHATALQSKNDERKGASLTNSHVTRTPPPSPLNCMLSRLNQAEHVATNARSTNSETVYSRNVSRRVRFLLESVPSPQEVRGWRLVIDLSKLNEFLTPVTFQMDTLVKVKSVAERGMFATSLDLSDAYHHIPMRKDSHVYLCFQVKDKRYMYLVLPFGLMTAPLAFTQVVKQVKI